MNRLPVPIFLTFSLCVLLCSASSGMAQQAAKDAQNPETPVVASAAQTEKKSKGLFVSRLPAPSPEGTLPWGGQALPLKAAFQIREGVTLLVPEGTEPQESFQFPGFTEPFDPGALKPVDPSVPAFFSRPEIKENSTAIRIPTPEGADLYGTGSVTGPLRRNGREVIFWNTDNFVYKKDPPPGTDMKEPSQFWGHARRLYQSHPWVLGLRPDGSAFGVMFLTTWRSSLRTGDRHMDFFSEGPPNGIIWIEKSTPQEVMTELSRLVGVMPLPPKWSLGYQQSRWNYFPDTDVARIAGEFRKRKLPCDVIWIDIDYMDGFRTFTFAPKFLATFKTPAALNAHLHDQGFKAVWMINPGVKKTEPSEGYFVYDEGTKRNAWVRDEDNNTFVGKVWAGPSVFPDYTRPDVREWWASLYKDFMSQGVDGVWNDMNEPAVMGGADGTMPDTARHDGGGELEPGPHLQYHNLYGHLMARASHAGILAANPEKRPFLLTRAGFLGSQRYAAMWTGDNRQVFEQMRISIPMSLSISLSGQPFNGPDIGGFSQTKNVEVYRQWFVLGPFYPFMRQHVMKDAPKEPWQLGPEIEAAAKTALERRYRLLPYIYTQFEAHTRDGRPIMAPVFFADPKDKSLREEDQAFLFGPELLVIPRWALNPDSEAYPFAASIGAHKPSLPKGNWRSVSLVGEATDDPLQPDLRIREGAIVPLGRVIQNTTEKSLDPLTLLVSLDEAGRAEGTLYEDDDDGFSYREGDFLRTTYRAEKIGDTVRVRIAGQEGKRERPDREIEVMVVTDDAVKSGRGADGDVTVALK